MSNTRHVSVRLDRDQVLRLQEIGRCDGRTVSELVRAAVAAFLGGQDLARVSARRIARIQEFSMICLDVLIREQHPELRDRIVAETDRRLRCYHEG